MSAFVSTLRTEVKGGIPPGASEVDGLVKRRAIASVREGSQEVEKSIRQLARPSYDTGAFSRGLVVDTPRVVGDSVVGGVSALAPHSQVLEEGRPAVVPKRAKALRLRLRGGRVIYRSRVGPARGRHYVKLGRKAAEPAVQAIAHKWARAVADDIRGRIRRGA